MDDGPYQGAGEWIGGDPDSIPVTLHHGVKTNLYVRYRNTFVLPLDIRVDLFSGSAQNIVLKVFKGDKDVTDRTLFGPGIKFPGVGPGASTTALRVQLRPRQSASEGEGVLVTATGGVNSAPPGCGDQVRAEAKVAAT